MTVVRIANVLGKILGEHVEYVKGLVSTRAEYRYAVYIKYRFLAFDISTEPDPRVSNKISILDFGTFKWFSMPKKVCFPK